MNAAHLKELISLGITGETLVRVAEIIDEEASMASMDKSADSRRGPLESTAEQTRKERDKQRKRADRAKKKAAELSALASKDASTDKADVRPDEEEKNRSLQGKTKKENKRGSRLQSGARISDEFRTAAIDSGCPPDRVDGLWTEFVDYWSDIPGQKGCKLSWLGTWRNRVKHLFQKAGNGNATSQNRTNTAAGRATARELDQVTIMGGAGLRYLQEGKSAGVGRDLPDGSGAAEIFDFGERAKNAG